jgi:hypothetical protein
MQVELMGYKTFAIAMYQFRNEFQSLYRVLEKKANERYKLISESLAEIINGGDNINSEIVSPRLFDQYITPFL